jgi:hypothetical protein
LVDRVELAPAGLVLPVVVVGRLGLGLAFAVVVAWPAPSVSQCTPPWSSPVAERRRACEPVSAEAALAWVAGPALCALGEVWVGSLPWWMEWVDVGGLLLNRSDVTRQREMRTKNASE